MDFFYIQDSIGASQAFASSAQAGQIELLSQQLDCLTVGCVPMPGTITTTTRKFRVSSSSNSSDLLATQLTRIGSESCNCRSRRWRMTLRS